jgi:hypothetical protein
VVLITPRSGVRSPLGVLLHSTALRQNIGESQLFRRWVYSSVVEQPIAARQVTGSNPVGPFRLSVWLNWIEYLTTDQKVPGSSPGSDKHMVAWPSGLRRQLKALVREGVGSNPTAIIHNGVTLAEWLRRWPAKPLCSARVGSNPSGDGIWGCSSHTVLPRFRRFPPVFPKKRLKLKSLKGQTKAEEEGPPRPWEMLGEVAPPRRTRVARTVGAPKRLIPEADGKKSAEAPVAKSFKFIF